MTWDVYEYYVYQSCMFQKNQCKEKGGKISASSLIQIKVKNNKMKINGAEITFNLN